MSELQHYVPRLLLRRFTNEDGHLWAYDKHEERSFTPSPDRVAGEGNFYELEFQGNHVSLEDNLGRVEDQAAPIIRKILEAESLSQLDAENMRILAVFLAVQWLRTRNTREFIIDSFDQLQKEFEKRGLSVEDITMSERDAKAFAMAQLALEAESTYAPMFREKDWILMRAPENYPFILSDNPVVLTNPRTADQRGTIGLMVKGVQIFLPLSPQLALCLLSPVYYPEFKSTLEQAERMAEGPKMIALGRIAKLHNFVQAIEQGSLYYCSEQAAIHYRYLQIYSAERWIFSAKDESAFIEEVISNRPDLKTGPRGIVGW